MSSGLEAPWKDEATEEETVFLSSQSQGVTHSTMGLKSVLESPEGWWVPPPPDPADLRQHWYPTLVILIPRDGNSKIRTPQTVGEEGPVQP